MDVSVSAAFRSSSVVMWQFPSPSPSFCSIICSQPLVSSSVWNRRPLILRSSSLQLRHVSRFWTSRNRGIRCSASEAETEPEKHEDKENEVHEHADGEETSSSDINVEHDVHSKSVNEEQGQGAAVEALDSLETSTVDSNKDEITGQDGAKDEDAIEVASGSPLPGMKPRQLDPSARIPKEDIDILKTQVFGFDTFFVTGQEPYEGGVLFRGNLRGKSDQSYEKLSKRLQDKFEDKYKIFLLINPEDDKPVAVVVPRKTLQPETTALPEWFAAASFGVVTVFTLLLRNVPALQSNIMSTFDNIELLKNGLPGALVTALILGVHELGHYIAAKDSGVKLGVPFFVPSWQIGSFGAITRIVNIVPKREDLLKVAVAGPLAGFSAGLILLLLGFILPPSDGIGLIVDPSVFHESFLAGGTAKLLLGDALKEGTPISVNPLVLWAWAGLLINAINSIPAGELDGGRISFAIWGRKASSRITGVSIALLGLSALLNDVAFYWVALIFFLQRGPISPHSEEVTAPSEKYVALGITVLLLGLLVCLPYPFLFSNDAMSTFQ